MNAMQPPQSVEEVKATLETTEKGGVRQSIRNCLTVFQRDPVLAGAIAYNILTDRKDIIKPIGFHRESTALTDTDMKYLLLYLEETYGLTSEKKIETAIGIVANENKYHPIRDFLNSLAWDGTERIRFCLRHFLGADVDDYTYEALKLFMLGAITRKTIIAATKNVPLSCGRMTAFSRNARPLFPRRLPPRSLNPAK